MKQTKTAPTKIRFSKKTDLPHIVHIYNQAIRSNGATGDLKEYSVEQRIAWFEKFNKNTYPLYIAQRNDRIIGFCYISPYRAGREAMATVAEISYYIDYDFHREGVGTALLKHAIADCPRIKIKHLLAFLLDNNKQSIAILKKFHFEKWGYFPDIININGQQCGHVSYGLKVY
ncbi:MAG: N-acetyltransferase [Bacteroidetes bacterium 4572_77]|nr:MAG: N-acetyltransferase [Bacteroidetes bacterium 4572_77]